MATNQEDRFGSPQETAITLYHIMTAHFFEDCYHCPLHDTEGGCMGQNRFRMEEWLQEETSDN